ncbi:MAG TPA: bifunctional folylpolyglutamate synthase/dihydrofolate synthase, partial [Sphingomicrobium sp.]|nr:bifunctional folylpolyglutamate synthase/dihydrofolate synthase [Sphingomicrobium sp.]
MLSPAGDRLGLERITELLERLGRPQEQLPPVFHVAGTNGKGSTVAFLRAALEASGQKVHVFTSPHLVRFNERIRIAGKLVDDERLSELLAQVLDVGSGVEPSFFEVTTAAAILAFAQTKADACILEVGLGGRLDATNVIERPLVTGIANLALDHQQFLGEGLGDIAAEKAGIAKAGVPLITQLYPPEVTTRIIEIARARGAPVLARGTTWDAIVRQGRLHYN